LRILALRARIRGANSLDAPSRGDSHLSVLEVVAILLAGLAAGTINAVVGSGTLISFPVLLSFGYAPVTANVSNSLGLAPGALAGTYGYRRQLLGQERRIALTLPCSIAGGIVGAVLLVTLPASAFKAIVPGFIAIALVLIILQPWISSRLAERRPPEGNHVAFVMGWVFLCGVYGGYFGAAQGILLLAGMSMLLPDGLQRLNAIKTLLAGGVNLVSGILFIFIAHIAWAPVGLLAVSSVAGGLLGSRYGRELSPTVLRGVIVVVGVFAIVRLLVWS
jgi:uncharacterized membrane protein YfcA